MVVWILYVVSTRTLVIPLSDEQLFFLRNAALTYADQHMVIFFRLIKYFFLGVLLELRTMQLTLLRWNNAVQQQNDDATHHSTQLASLCSDALRSVAGRIPDSVMEWIATKSMSTSKYDGALHFKMESYLGLTARRQDAPGIDESHRQLSWSIAQCALMLQANQLKNEGFFVFLLEVLQQVAPVTDITNHRTNASTALSRGGTKPHFPLLPNDALSWLTYLFTTGSLDQAAKGGIPLLRSLTRLPHPVAPDALFAMLFALVRCGPEKELYNNAR